MMVRKDFKAVAETIRLCKLNFPDDVGYHILASDLTIYFKKSNPSFDKEKFMKACGFYGG